MDEGRPGRRGARCLILERRRSIAERRRESGRSTVQDLNVSLSSTFVRKSILLVDDDQRVLSMLRQYFTRLGWDVSSAPDGRTGVELYERDAPDVVVTDLEMPGLSGLQVVDVLRSRDPEAVVLVLTGRGDIPTAVEALKLGAETFLTKPVDLEHLGIAVERAREKARLRRRVMFDASRDASPALAALAALSSAPAMRRLGGQLPLLAAGTAPVLLGGETGTGKGWLARRIHAMSPRAAGPFVDLNCAGLTATFLDSELFGHEKGAFTDAKQAKRGLFEIADGGTLFLDEVGDLAPELQPKLLKVLESQRFRRLGGTREIEVDVRLVAATNVDLREAVRARRFREDLYYRLAVAPLVLPPLRERGAEEIARLTHTLLDELRRRVAHGPTRITADALLALTRYAWPGNIRELRNVLERALLLATGADAIEPAHLPPEIASAAHDPPTFVPPVNGAPAATAPPSRPAPEPSGDATMAPQSLTLAAAERTHILRVLALARDNKTEAARALGITRATLYAKLRKYQLDDVSASRGG
jgi:DNA-binding NtrC family response regulator